MILLVDNYDSFTYNLVDYFEQLGIKCKVLRNDDALSKLTSISCTGLVLSPGPMVPAKAGVLMQVIRHYEKKIPILGICLGHQAIGEFFGAKLKKAIKPMHGKISPVQQISEHQLFHGIQLPLNVVRYHSLVLYDLPPGLIATSRTNEGEIMSLKHNLLPIWGIQFHPEAALTDEGLKLLGNWIVYNNIT